jgi:hypothetical protein
VATGLSVLDVVLEGLAPSNSMGPAGTAVAVADEGPIIAPVTREQAPLSLEVRWASGAAAELVHWDRVGKLSATVDRGASAGRPRQPPAVHPTLVQLNNRRSFNWAPDVGSPWAPCRAMASISLAPAPSEGPQRAKIHRSDGLLRPALRCA